MAATTARKASSVCWGCVPPLSVRMGLSKPPSRRSSRTIAWSARARIGRPKYRRRTSSDTDRLAQAGSAGELDVRANAQGHKGKYAEVIEGINSFIEAVATPMQEVTVIMKQMADGDLTCRINGDYQGQFAELKENINESLARMENVIGQVSEAVQQVTAGGQQIADASQSLSQGATEQAASLEEITSSMAQIGSQITSNAENSNNANRLSTGAKGAATDGSENMRKMVDAMKDISVSSQQIAKVNKVIDDIAFQTNLLALNAAVEAARAGVHGKGFAVVAGEVRNLAGRSAKAAKETAEIIEESIRKVDNGLKVAEHTHEAFNTIVDGIVKVSDLAGEIAIASNEQAQGISQVNQGLGQIDQVTQQNTAHAEETAAAAEELSGQATQLQNLIRQFKLSNNNMNNAAPQYHEAAPMRSSVPPKSGFKAPAKAAHPGKPGKDGNAPRMVTMVKGATHSGTKPAPEVASNSWGKAASTGKDLISFDEDDFGRF